MRRFRVRKITSLIIVIFLASFTLFSQQKSNENPKKSSQRPSSEEEQPSRESQALKKEISKKIVKTKNKILFIGLDAADWVIIDPLLKEGKLPHLAKLKKEGAWGDLQSVPPTLSPIIWTSIATGKPPEEHGIADFLALDTITGEKVPISRVSRKVKAIWNIYSDFGISCDIIGWWATWPAERINGHMITERVSYNLFNLSEEDFSEEGKTYPPHLFREMESLIVTAEEISYEEIRNFIHISQDEYNQAWREVESGHKFDNRINHLRKILASTKTFYNVTLKLLERDQPDFLAVYFEGIDTICHRFMLYMPPKLERVSSEDYQRFKDAVENFYVYQDKLVGDLLASVSSDTTVVVISDHGFYSGGQRPFSQPDDFVTGAQDWHRPAGILILSGKWIQSGRIKGANIFDVAPTLLYLSGFPIPEDMVGKPLAAAISTDFINAFHLAKINSYERVNPMKHEEVLRVSKSDKERLEELRSLGYISGGSRKQTGQESLSSAKDYTTTATTHYNLGRNYLDKRQYARAEEEFKKALSIDPNFQYALYFLARTYKEQGKIEEAIDNLKKIISSSSSEVFPMTYISLTSLYLEIGDTEAAEEILRSALATKREVSEIYSSLGMLYEQRRDMKEAEKEYLKALELNPLDFSAIRRIFPLYCRQNRIHEAESIIQKASSIPDVPTTTLNDLGAICLQERRFVLAEKMFNDTLTKDPRSLKAMMNLGFCYAYQGRFEEAKSVFLKALEEKPDDAKILYNLGALYANTGNLNEALKTYKKVLEVEKESTDVYNALADVYHQLGDKRSSLEMLNKSLQLNPNQPDVENMIHMLEKEEK